MWSRAREKVSSSSPEAEVAFVMGAALPPRAGQPYTEDEVWGAVKEVACALEVCGNRIGFNDPSPAQIMADCTNNAGVVLGSRCARDAVAEGQATRPRGVEPTTPRRASGGDL